MIRFVFNQYFCQNWLCTYILKGVDLIKRNQNKILKLENWETTRWKTCFICLISLLVMHLKGFLLVFCFLNTLLFNNSKTEICERLIIRKAFPETLIRTPYRFVYIRIPCAWHDFSIFLMEFFQNKRKNFKILILDLL